MLIILGISNNSCLLELLELEKYSDELFLPFEIAVTLIIDLNDFLG